ncbi:Rhodanese-like protein, partial [Rhodotorula sp. JG-1b]
KWKNGEKVTYNEVKPLTQSPSDKILLIDVREPNEVALGSIPSSVNLPLSTFEKNLSMDEGDFTRVNGFHKPTKQQPMIFYCRSGVRAQTAVDLAKAAGYKWARNYEGSYTDWQKHEESNPNKDD